MKTFWNRKLCDLRYIGINTSKIENENGQEKASKFEELTKYSNLLRPH